ncbi:MAG: proline--tRNA ligase [Pyrinomonadaceae bacterium]|nr:proline--tRNA ligase [Pyrinomonadaceae bacterium]
MAKTNITPREKDYSQWYLDIVEEAGMAENSGVRGCMVIKPHGYAIWELIQAAMDKRIKETGHVNAYFPLLIPKSYLMKEAEHVEGFAPEVAEVTRAGGEELAEPYVIRPTSETIIGATYAKWIKSWRDLPVLVNQWANVMRWEMRTRPFLRTSEFLWQEGHTAHATEDEAERETLMILHDVYTDVVERVMAIPVLRGLKTENEKFAGALRTYAIEALMQDGKALQAGTSHNLGQNFARSFEIKYTTPDNREEFCWTTSWGVSTRLVGALIMAHSDDDGLVLPPQVAPVQVVVVPIFKNEEERAQVMEVVNRITSDWRDRFRWKLDERDHVSPGFKFNEWEVKGVPVRVEVGMKDVAKGTVAVARRDVPGREGKSFVEQKGLTERITALLVEIQQSLFDRALRFREEHTFEAETYEDFKTKVERGFVRVYFDGTGEDEDKIKADTKATVRVLPFDQPEEEGVCFYTGRKTKRQAIFARSY